MFFLEAHEESNGDLSPRSNRIDGDTAELWWWKRASTIPCIHQNADFLFELIPLKKLAQNSINEFPLKKNLTIRFFTSDIIQSRRASTPRMILRTADHP